MGLQLKMQQQKPRQRVGSGDCEGNIATIYIYMMLYVQEELYLFSPLDVMLLRFAEICTHS